MRHAVSVPPGGAPADLIDCARVAEESGWDAFFLWDHIYLADGVGLHDPWVLLGAIAAGTSRLRLGTMVTPLARRHPWKLAKEIITLDRLSGGRTIVGIGLGTPDVEFTAFGQSADPRERAALLDESLILLDGFLRGDTVDHDGPRYHVHARLSPTCVQRPRPPIWAAAVWPHRRPLDRAARLDGVFALGEGAVTGPSLEQIALIRRRLPEGLDLVVPKDPAIPVDAYERAGVTWLVTGPDEPSGDWLSRLRTWIEAGPPR